MICFECGKEYNGVLAHKSSKYCGIVCRKIVRSRVNEKNKKNRKKRINDGDVKFIANEVYLKYKQKAPSRGLEFSLTLEFFEKNVKANCYYCDEVLLKVGFDRINNTIGYTEKNSVPCCPDCNFMKRNMNVDDFINKCISICNKHSKITFK